MAGNKLNYRIGVTDQGTDKITKFVKSIYGEGNKAVQVVERTTTRVNALNQKVREYERFVKRGTQFAKKGFHDADRAITAAKNSQTKLTTAADAGARAMEKQSRATRNAGQQMNRATRDVTNFDRALQRITRTAAAFVAMFVLREIARGFRDLLGVGFRFNMMIEDSRLGLGALLASTQDYVDSQGQLLSGQEELNAAITQAETVQKRLQYANLRTAATFEQLMEAYRHALVPGIAAGFDTAKKEVSDFSVRFVQAMTAMGIPLQQVSEEVRSVLQGTMVSRHTRIAPLFMSYFNVADITAANKKLREAAKSGNLFETVMDALKQTAQGAVLAMENLSVKLSNLQDAFSFVMGKSLSRTFQTTKDLIDDLTASMVIINDEAQTMEVNPEFVNTMRSLDNILSDLMRTFAELGRTFANINREHPKLLGLVTKIAGMGAVVLAAVGSFRLLVKVIRGFFSVFTKQFSSLTTGGILAGIPESAGKATVAFTVLGRVVSRFLGAAGLLLTAFEGLRVGVKVFAGDLKVLGVRLSDLMEEFTWSEMFSLAVEEITKDVNTVVDHAIAKLNKSTQEYFTDFGENFSTTVENNLGTIRKYYATIFELIGAGWDKTMEGAKKAAKEISSGMMFTPAGASPTSPSESSAPKTGDSRLQKRLKSLKLWAEVEEKENALREYAAQTQEDFTLAKKDYFMNIGDVEEWEGIFEGTNEAAKKLGSTIADLSLKVREASMESAGKDFEAALAKAENAHRKRVEKATKEYEEQRKVLEEKVRMIEVQKEQEKELNAVDTERMNKLRADIAGLREKLNITKSLSEEILGQEKIQARIEKRIKQQSRALELASAQVSLRKTLAEGRGDRAGVFAAERASILNSLSGDLNKSNLSPEERIAAVTKAVAALAGATRDYNKETASLRYDSVSRILDLQMEIAEVSKDYYSKVELSELAIRKLNQERLGKLREIEEERKEGVITEREKQELVRLTNQLYAQQIELQKRIAEGGFGEGFVDQIRKMASQTETAYETGARMGEAIVGNATDALSGMFDDIVIKGKNAFDALNNALLNFANNVLSVINRMAAEQLVLGLFRGIFGGGGGGGGIHSTGGGAYSGTSSGWGRYGHHAFGGPVQKDQPYMVGERGPEMFIPRSSGTIVSNENLRRSESSPTVIQNFNITGDVSQKTREELFRMMPTIKAETISAMENRQSRGRRA